MPRRNRSSAKADDPVVRLPQRWAYHVSSSANRPSILEHGLDVTRMGTAAGIAGSTVPEVEGIYLARSRSEALWFASFPIHQSVDIWLVDAHSLRVQEHQDGFVYYSGSISADMVRLDEADLSPARARQRQAEVRRA